MQKIKNNQENGLDAVKFDEKYKQESLVLQNIYSLPPKFKCPRGHAHYFNFMNCKSGGEIQVIPLRYCNV